jgi:hypothetical protein
VTYPPEPRWSHLPRRKTPDQPTQDRVTTYEEWRVSGTLPSGKPFATKFEHEVAARRLVDRGRAMGWTDGPHLHKRTVTVTDWEDA